MNIIVVDDKPHALSALETTIKNVIPDCELSGFTSSREALSYAEENQIDIAFLDIEMPGMNGLILAKKMKEIYSKTNIIFATGYSQYALNAFSLYASDYLLKPVSEDAVRNALEQLRNPVEIKTDKRMRVQTFGNFEVYVDDNHLIFKRSKTKEMLAYLISRQGAFCTNNEIIAAIWENKPNSINLQAQFRNLVLDLTQTLKSVGINDVLVKQRGKLAIATDKVSCDLFDFCDRDSHAVNRYTGEFMTQYSWAEFTIGYLENKSKI